MAEWCEERGVDVWAYCLIPNHVHLIVVPATEQSLRLGIGEAHRRYSRHASFREGWRSHLWQGRFASFPMAEAHLYAATRYVELDPVRAKLVSDPTEYRWSSARAHVKGQDDGLVKVQPLLDRFGDWPVLLASGLSEEDGEVIRSHERTGRPLGPPRSSAGWSGCSVVRSSRRNVARSRSPNAPARVARTVLARESTYATIAISYGCPQTLGAAEAARGDRGDGLHVRAIAQRLVPAVDVWLDHSRAARPSASARPRRSLTPSR